MSKKQKIKKGSKSPFEFWGLLNTKERVVVLIPVLVAVVAVAAFFVIPRGGNASTAKGSIEARMETDGQWTTFGDYGIEMWAPKEIAEEKVEGDRGSYAKLYATRDKGGFPEITVGSFVVPNVETADLDVTTDANDVMNVIRPYIYEEFMEMFNGVSPALSGDINIIDLDGVNVLEFKGTAELTVVYTDPTGKRDNGEPYSELTDTNIYYMVRILNGRPICVWGTWDYSTYLGEERVMAAVKDGITSILKTKGAKVPDIEGIPTDENGEIQKDDGISSADKEDGLVSVPYEGAGGNQWDLPIDIDGNPIDVEGWVPTPGENPIPPDTFTEPEGEVVDGETTPET